MTITQEQVDELTAGDVVRLTLNSGSTIEGKLVEANGESLWIDGVGWAIKASDGRLTYNSIRQVAKLELVRRVPRLKTATLEISISDHWFGTDGFASVKDMVQMALSGYIIRNGIKATQTIVNEV